jgi:hypothetical protein
MEEVSFRSDDDESVPSRLDKADRRSRLGQCVGRLQQAIQRGVLRVLPPQTDDHAFEDLTNDESWRWSFGTREDDGVWCNVTDSAGLIIAILVWVLFLYSGLTLVVLAQNGHLPMPVTFLQCTLCTLALASHAKTMLTDPGTVPASAIPSPNPSVRFHAMCSVCNVFKPEQAHHCRICNRCVSGMDHHCPWMNNCIGTGNLKHFILFLSYTWTGSVLALILFSVNYFGCNNENCEFSGVEIQLVRVMTWLCIGALLFTSSMLMNVIYTIMTGVGTIDRLKKKAMNEWNEATEDAIPMRTIFGIGPRWTWCLPTDPLWDSYDAVMGYATVEQMRRARQGAPEKGPVKNNPLAYNKVDV